MEKYDQNTDARVLRVKLTYISLFRQSFMGGFIKIRHKITTYIPSLGFWEHTSEFSQKSSNAICMKCVGIQKKPVNHFVITNVNNYTLIQIMINPIMNTEIRISIVFGLRWYIKLPYCPSVATEKKQTNNARSENFRPKFWFLWRTLNNNIMVPYI